MELQVRGRREQRLGRGDQRDLDLDIDIQGSERAQWAIQPCQQAHCGGASYSKVKHMDFGMGFPDGREQDCLAMIYFVLVK